MPLRITEGMELALNCSTEVKILIACATPFKSNNRARQIENLLKKELNWERLFDIAYRHRVKPLLCHALIAAGRDSIPGPILSHACEYIATTSAHNNFLAKQLTLLLNLFQSNGIAAIPFKGPVLASSLYGDLALRQIGDLDILLSPYHYHRKAREILVSHGWRLLNDFGYECTFVNEPGTVFADLHKSFTHDRVLFHHSFYRMWQGRDSILFGSEQLPMLAPMDILISQCLQVTKDGRLGQLELLKVCDIAQFLVKHSRMDWKEMLRVAEGQGLLNTICLGILMANRVFGALVPEVMTERLQFTSHLSLLLNHLEQCISLQTEGRRTSSHPEFLDTAAFDGELRDATRRKMYDNILNVLEPNDRDYACVALTDYLTPLYYLVRPIRLLCKCGDHLIRKMIRLKHPE